MDNFPFFRISVYMQSTDKNNNNKKGVTQGESARDRCTVALSDRGIWASGLFQRLQLPPGLYRTALRKQVLRRIHDEWRVFRSLGLVSTAISHRHFQWAVARTFRFHIWPCSKWSNHVWMNRGFYTRFLYISTDQSFGCCRHRCLRSHWLWIELSLALRHPRKWLWKCEA